MYSAYSSMRKILINDFYVSSTVTSNNIRVGFQRKIDAFPCITIQRVGGDSFGKLGYLESTGGSRDREETRLMQIDIYHTDSVEDLEKLDDYVTTAIFSGARSQDGFRQIGNIGDYDDTYASYRVTQTWSYDEQVQD